MLTMIFKEISMEGINKNQGRKKPEVGGIYTYIHNGYKFYIVENQSYKKGKFKISLDLNHLNKLDFQGFWHTHNFLCLPSIQDFRTLYLLNLKLSRKVSVLIISNSNICILSLFKLSGVKFPSLKFSKYDRYL